MSGLGYLMVRASWVTTNGTPLAATPILLIRQCSLVRSRVMTSMNPAGKLTSVRTLPSTLTNRCMRGPWDGLGAYTPVSLSNIQWLGALSRFRCFFCPRVMIYLVPFNLLDNRNRTQKWDESPC